MLGLDVKSVVVGVLLGAFVLPKVLRLVRR